MFDYRTARGWLRPEEREFLHRVSDVAGKDGVIVNIGVEFGASMVCFRMGNQFCTIYGIDLDLSKAPDGKVLGVKYLRGDSGVHAQNMDQWLPGKIDVLFIDGDHTYDGVTRDTVFAERVRPGGYLIFHDCYDYNDPSVIHKIVPGVDAAVSHWYRTYADTWEEHDQVGTMRVFVRKDV